MVVPFTKIRKIGKGGKKKFSLGLVNSETTTGHSSIDEILQTL